MPAIDPAVMRGRVAGTWFVVVAYAIWGFLPLYFVALEPIGPWEIVAWRVIFTFATCLIALAVVRGWSQFACLCSQPRTLLLLGAAAVAIYGNWQFFLIGAALDQVVEVALGYFMNPVVTALLARVALKERLSRAQWWALGICTVAILVLVVGHGTFPWIAMGITVTFAAYSLLKKIVGPSVGALEGVAMETVWLLPVGIVQLVLVAAAGPLMIAAVAPGQVILMAAAGIITGAPLLLFAAGARRIGLVSTALAQFISPIVAFLIGVLVLHEHMSWERWVGFGLVWVAVLLVSTDLVVRGSRARRLRRPHRERKRVPTLNRLKAEQRRNR
jgi:chloramphenicol-sensitive protein RarD